MTIKVVLIRHAIVNVDPKQGSTSAISALGRAIQRQVDGYMKEIGLIPSEVWHSPIQRAKETAQVIGDDFHAPLKEENSLGEFLDEIDIIEKLALVKAGSSIFCVSHGPQIMRMSSFFLGQQLLRSQIKNSAALVIEFPGQVSEGNGIYMNAVTPEFVMRLKGKPHL